MVFLLLVIRQNEIAMLSKSFMQAAEFFVDRTGWVR